MRAAASRAGRLTAIADISGVLIVDKPAGVTSHDVVDRVRRLFRTRRVGHTGTLDPDATGVLVLCLGNATRLAEYLSSSAKHYVTEFVFGVRTDTMDASGVILAEEHAAHLTDQSILALLPSFRGRILQTPPMVSARHHQGRRLYELAREGVTVEREAREVVIDSLELICFEVGQRPCAVLEVTCSTGTYIRVLADDLGRSAGTGAMMRSLRRTWVGMNELTAFTLNEAHTLEDLAERAGAGTIESALMSLADGLRAIPHYRAVPEGRRKLRHGQSISLAETTEVRGSELAGIALAVVLDEHGDVFAVVRRDDQILHPIKVLSPNEAS